MGLSNYQLVLLDNLIYLDTTVKYGNITLGEIVRRLLYKDGNPAVSEPSKQIGGIITNQKIRKQKTVYRLKQVSKNCFLIK